jgi:hypothetical protein
MAIYGLTNNVEELLLWADEQDFPLDVVRQSRQIPVSPEPSSHNELRLNRLNASFSRDYAC